MKKHLMILLLSVLLLVPVLAVQEGGNCVDVGVDGKGIEVYAKKSGGQPVGTMYNGCHLDLYPDVTDGRYACDLTGDYTVWLDREKAEKNQPEGEDIRYYSDEWDALMPCDIFVAEVIRQDAPFYTSPDHAHLSAKHAPGTLMMICGEFGNDYYVNYGSDCVAGFMPKSALRKVRDMTYAQAFYSSLHWGLEDVWEMPVYTGGITLAVGASATGYSDISPGLIRDGETVTVLATLDGWAQLDSGYFVEIRFLDPEGDHSVTYATVKTSGILNRLNVRDGAGSDTVWAKLSSGTRVQVPSHTEEWAAVFFTGPRGGARETGSVKMEFLVFGDASKVKSGGVRVRCTQTLNGDSKVFWYTAGDSYKDLFLPAGTEMTVVGFSCAIDSFICLLDDGTAIYVTDSGGVLEPVESLGISVKTISETKMRTAPDREAQTVRTLNQGTKVEVLLRGDSWTMVKYRDQTGYVMSRYLQFP